MNRGWPFARMTSRATRAAADVVFGEPIGDGDNAMTNGGGDEG